MSIENRLAAKKRSQKARRRASVNKAVKILLTILIPLVVVGAIVGIYLNYQSKKIEYSKYVTADGSIDGVTAKDYLSVLADYKNMDITLSDYEPTEEEVEEEIEDLYEDVQKEEEEEEEEEEKETTSGTSSESDEAEDTDTEDSDKEDEEDTESVLDKITDAWVAEHFEEELGEDYEFTKDGFVEYVTDTVRENKLASLRSDISTWLNENSTIREYPKKYTKNLIQIYRNEEKEAFESYAAFYAQYNYNTVYDIYGGKDQFEAAMEKNAKSEVKTTLICLAIYDELGLTTADADVEKYYTEDQGQDYDGLVERYGKEYLKLQYKCAQVLDYLEDSVQ